MEPDGPEAAGLIGPESAPPRRGVGETRIALVPDTALRRLRLGINNGAHRTKRGSVKETLFALDPDRMEARYLRIS